MTLTFGEFLTLCGMLCTLMAIVWRGASIKQKLESDHLAVKAHATAHATAMRERQESFAEHIQESVAAIGEQTKKINSIVPKIATDVAVLKTDVAYLTKRQDTHSGQLKAVTRGRRVGVNEEDP